MTVQNDFNSVYRRRTPSHGMTFSVERTINRLLFWKWSRGARAPRSIPGDNHSRGIVATSKHVAIDHLYWFCFGGPN